MRRYLGWFYRPSAELLLRLPERRRWQATRRSAGAPYPGGAALPLSVRITSSQSSYRSRRLQDYLRHLGSYQHLCLGSALKSCLIAEGEADLYPRFGPTGEWDTAAAQVILEESGGYLTDMQLRPLRYNTRPVLINPDFFAFGDATRDWSQYLPHHYHGLAVSTSSH
ncbi:MAG: inositol monophosphatase family protein [Candidatus Competibacteraceae bacterium]